MAAKWSCERLKDNTLPATRSPSSVSTGAGGKAVSVPLLVDHLFRHKAGQMISALTRYFGVENLELVEDIVQETLLKALQQWSYRGVPENPGGWLWQTAKNHALDVLRREARFQKRLQGEIQLIEMQYATAGQAAD